MLKQTPAQKSWIGANKVYMFISSIHVCINEQMMFQYSQIKMQSCYVHVLTAYKDAKSVLHTLKMNQMVPIYVISVEKLLKSMTVQIKKKIMIT